jgi:Dolichyl-phosphate-mannose-protein mannosyltransferase
VPISRLPVKLVLQIVLLLAASVIGFLYLQMCHGGFTSDLGGDPDEAAHAVTALMVRDYLVGSLGTSPLAFASNYYEIFPKVALGHYPPGYYLPAAIALSLSCSPGVLIAMQAVWAATLAMLGWLFARRWITEGDGLLAIFPALILLLNNEVVRVGCHVLSDLQLAALVFAAFWAWHQYLRRPSWRAGLAFGFLAAAAILTKGSAMGLAGVPLLTVLLGRRWQDVKTFHWWASAIPVLFLAGPWMAYSVRFTQEGFVEYWVGPLRYCSSFHSPACSGITCKIKSMLPDWCCGQAFYRCKDWSWWFPPVFLPDTCFHASCPQPCWRSSNCFS